MLLAACSADRRRRPLSLDARIARSALPVTAERLRRLREIAALFLRLGSLHSRSGRSCRAHGGGVVRAAVVSTSAFSIYWCRQPDPGPVPRSCDFPGYEQAGVRA